jgi:hypothetical protein
VTNEKLQSVLTQIAGLREQAKIERGSTPHEAEAAAAKIAEIMLKYNLSEHDLNSVDGVSHYADSLTIVKVASPPDLFRSHLLAVIATAHGGICVGLEDQNTEYERLCEVYGQSHDLPVIVETWKWLSQEIVVHAQIAWKFAVDCDDQIALDLPYTWKEDFKHGMVRGIHNAYAAMREEVKEDIGASEYALVVLMNNEVEQFMQSHQDGKAVRDVSTLSTYASAYEAGRSTGEAINLDKQIGVAETIGQLHM